MRPIINEFLFTCLDLNRLQSELKAIVPSILATILIDEKLQVQTSAELTEQEIGLIEDFLLEFVDSDPNLKIPKIYDLTNSTAKHFHDIDYVIEVRLFPKRTVVKGEVVSVSWFSDEAMSDLALRADISYVRDGAGFALYRTVTRTWINRDGSENEEKKITKKIYFHNPSDMISEGLKRRKLLVNSVQIPTLTFMMEALIPEGKTNTEVLFMGRRFLDDYALDFTKFIENSSTITDSDRPDFGKKTVIVELEGTTGRNEVHNYWLDKTCSSLGGVITIRQYLINEFST